MVASLPHSQHNLWLQSSFCYLQENPFAASHYLQHEKQPEYCPCEIIHHRKHQALMRFSQSLCFIISSLGPSFLYSLLIKLHSVYCQSPDTYMQKWTCRPGYNTIPHNMFPYKLYVISIPFYLGWFNWVGQQFISSYSSFNSVRFAEPSEKENIQTLSPENTGGNVKQT